MNPIVFILIKTLNLFSWQLTIWFLLSWLIHYRVVNVNQSLVSSVFYTLDRLNTPILYKIRTLIKPINGVDLSPIILFLLIEFLISLLSYYG
jgi:YggT family protein